MTGRHNIAIMGLEKFFAVDGVYLQPETVSVDEYPNQRCQYIDFFRRSNRFIEFDVHRDTAQKRRMIPAGFGQNRRCQSFRFIPLYRRTSVQNCGTD